MIKNRNKYTDEFKNKLAKEYLYLKEECGYTINEIKDSFFEKYGINDITSFIKLANMGKKHFGDKIVINVSSDDACRRIGIARAKLKIDQKTRNHESRSLHKLANEIANFNELNKTLKNYVFKNYKLDPITNKEKVKKDSDKNVIYAIGDIHYRGSIDNELIKLLFNKINLDIKTHNYQDAELGLLGDYIDGEIHNEQIRENETLTDCVNQISNLLICYINAIPEIKAIKMVYGNHDEIRLGGDKGTKNNAGKLIANSLRIGLRDDIDLLIPPKDHKTKKERTELFFKYKDKFILLAHGHQKGLRNKNKMIETCASVYKTLPDVVLLGHFHSSKSNQFSKNCGSITVPAVKNGESDGDIDQGYCGFGQYIKLKLNRKSPQITTEDIEEDE